MMDHAIVTLTLSERPMCFHSEQRCSILQTTLPIFGALVMFVPTGIPRRAVFCVGVKILMSLGRDFADGPAAIANHLPERIFAPDPAQNTRALWYRAFP